MLRRGSVLLGLAVLLSLLFPLHFLLRQGGIDPQVVHVPGADLAALGALVALIPARLLFGHAQLAQRIPRWSAWAALLAACSLLYLALHVNWSLEQLGAAFGEGAAAAGLATSAASRATLVSALELLARIGVLVAAVAVLVRLDGPPGEDMPVATRRRRTK